MKNFNLLIIFFIFLLNNLMKNMKNDLIIGVPRRFLITKHSYSDRYSYFLEKPSFPTLDRKLLKTIELQLSSKHLDIKSVSETIL